MTAVDIETVSLSDLEFEPPCESEYHRRRRETAPPSDWIAWLVQCCPAAAVHMLLCDRCVQRILEPQRCVMCSVCGMHFHPASALLRRVEPLRGGKG